VVKLPVDLIESTPLVDFRRATSQDEATAMCVRSPYSEAIGMLVEYCRMYCAQAEGFTVHRVALRPPGLLTTTIDANKGRRIGIHVDSWDQVPIERRAEARNRMNINLGSGDRFLLFVRQSVLKIVASQTNSEPQLGPTGAARDWMAADENEPIFRLRVAPGEAYIAPTDLIPHDSTTADKREVDISLTLLGHFHGLKNVGVSG
jgi:hypothetical protein